MKILIGKIVNTKGISGELKLLVNPLFSDVELKKNSQIEVNQQIYKITKLTRVNHLWFFSLKEYLDINKIEHLIGENAYVFSEDLMKPNKGYYRFELTNFLVYDQFEQLVGKVLAVETTGFQDILRIKREVKDGLVPMVNNFIKVIDFKEKIIQIQTIEGLL